MYFSDDWEYIAAIGTIVALIIFTGSSLLVYGSLIIYESVDILIPLKIIILFGVGYWIFITGLSFFLQDSGLMGLIIKSCSIISWIGSVILIYLSGIITYSRTISFQSDIGITLSFILCCAVIIIGLSLLIYHTFFE